MNKILVAIIGVIIGLLLVVLATVSIRGNSNNVDIESDIELSDYVDDIEIDEDDEIDEDIDIFLNDKKLNRFEIAEVLKEGDKYVKLADRLGNEYSVSPQIIELVAAYVVVFDILPENIIKWRLMLKMYMPSITVSVVDEQLVFEGVIKEEYQLLTLDNDLVDNELFVEFKNLVLSNRHSFGYRICDASVIRINLSVYDVIKYFSDEDDSYEQDEDDSYEQEEVIVKPVEPSKHYAPKPVTKEDKIDLFETNEPVLTKLFRPYKAFLTGNLTSQLTSNHVDIMAIVDDETLYPDVLQHEPIKTSRSDTSISIFPSSVEPMDTGKLIATIKLSSDDSLREVLKRKNDDINEYLYNLLYTSTPSFVDRVEESIEKYAFTVYMKNYDLKNVRNPETEQYTKTADVYTTYKVDDDTSIIITYDLDKYIKK